MIGKFDHITNDPLLLATLNDAIRIVHDRYPNYTWGVIRNGDKFQFVTIDKSYRIINMLRVGHGNLTNWGTNPSQLKDDMTQWLDDPENDMETHIDMQLKKCKLKEFLD